MTEKTCDRKALQIHKRFSPYWMTLPGVEVVAVGQFEGRPCIRILVSDISAELKLQVPDCIEGVPICIGGAEPFTAL